MAVIRMNNEIKKSAEAGCDGVSLCFNPNHTKALLVILSEYGFSDAHINSASSCRLDISW